MNLEQLTNLLHCMFCTLEHEEDMLALKTGLDSSKCHWYLEESIDKKWALRDHAKWRETATLFISIIEKKAPGELPKYLDILREFSRCYDELCGVGLEEFLPLLFLKIKDS